MVTISSSLVNIGLNYILIRSMGMMGAAVATCVSHCLQLTMHYVYCRYVLEKKNYPFGIRMWWKYAAAFAAMVVLVNLTPNTWLLRWGLGAAIGVTELLRIRKRKVLI